MISENAKLGTNVKIGLYTIIEDGATIGDNTVIGDFCVIRKDAVIGSNCKFTAYCEIREGVKIGDRTSFGSRCTISAGAVIGSDTTIKYGFVLTDTPNLEEGNMKSVGNIGNGVLIGANVCLMPGFSIEDGAIIGASSQVRSNVGKNEVWFGNPAKMYKKR